MKNILLFLVCMALSLGAFSQSLVGNWTIDVPDKDGNMVPLKLTIVDNGTYTVDFRMDGEVEVNGQYEVAGDQITIWDTDGGAGGCEAGAKGVYTIAVTDTELKMTRVSDECETRGGPDGVMTMTRM